MNAFHKLGFYFGATAVTAVICRLCFEVGENTANLHTRNTVLQELIDREFVEGRTNYSYMEVLSIVGRAAKPRWEDKENQWADWVERCETPTPRAITNFLIKNNVLLPGTNGIWIK